MLNENSSLQCYSTFNVCNSPIHPLPGITNTKAVFRLVFACFCTFTAAFCNAQDQPVDSSIKVFSNITIDSSKQASSKKPQPYDSTFSPRKSTIRSALIPGWGQVYNKQIWKVPLVYAALGITAGIFVVNVQEYNGLRAAYKLKVDTDTSNDSLIPARYSVLSANSMKFYRDEYRKNVDLSVLAFVIAWALNVVDATVSGHLKQFDVSDDLSMKIKPVFIPNGQTGVALVFNFKPRK